MLNQTVRYTVIVLTLSLSFALESRAQTNFPRYQAGIGYTYLDGQVGLGGPSTAHSGEALQLGMNFTPFVGLENYAALYNYHSGSTKEGMFADFIGPKISVRTAGRAIPYVVAGVGASFGTHYNTNTVPGIRAGGGVEIPVSQPLAFKFEFSTMWFHRPDGYTNWPAAPQILGGLVFNFGNRSVAR